MTGRNVKAYFRVATLTVATLAILFFLQSVSVRAEHDDFRFKWPYEPGVADGTTGYPFTAHHSGANAWDFDLGLNDVGENIVSSAEGTILSITSQFPPNTCDPNDGDGYGNHVLVEVPIPGSNSITLTYGHLASLLPITPNDRVLQGEVIGVEGKTGHTEGSEAPGYPLGSNNCGTHLHFQLDAERPERIDGDYVGSSGASSTPGGPSTNSAVGSGSVPGAAIKQKYRDLQFGLSWATVGWTADSTGNQGGCAPSSYCRLKVHYTLDPQYGRWGAVQTFRLHPDSNGREYDALMVGRWALETYTSALNNTYWVQRAIFAGWRAGWQDVGLPVADQESAGGAHCPVYYWNCLTYQRFNRGYVWEQTGSPASTVYSVRCLDYDLNYIVLTGDITIVLQAYGLDEFSTPPESDWNQARYDNNNDGIIRTADVTAVVQNYGTPCYPN